ncbi:MAG: hypothetical protein HYV26_15615 [Candidatus Hydrogenedentes bacterium]|nr:hypothetical protein [Candidatus Hydrogenedentota bacterium]MBI3118176.1 hypothetical protein [Candidatus Hydrogenedentota bacterium]
MTEQLAKVLERLTSLPPEEQDAYASFILSEMDSEARWDALFAQSQDVLAKLARQALQEDRDGLTAELDLDRDFETD